MPFRKKWRGTLKTDDSAALRILEFESIREKILELAVSPIGRERIETLPRYSDAELLRMELGRVTELKEQTLFDDPLPFHAFDDLRPWLKRAGVEGAFLQPVELLAIGRFLEMIRRLHTYFIEHQEKYPLVQATIKNIQPLKGVEQEIGRVIDPSGEVKEKASEDLFRIRREKERLISRVRKHLEAVLRRMISGGFAQEDALALRDGRLVVPLKETHRGRVKGIVVDQSASGATLFVEPLEIVEMNNEIRGLEGQERREIERILRDVTGRIREKQSEIEINLEAAGVLDCLMARARFSVRIDGHAARAGEDGVVELKNGRHPLFLFKERTEDVVPLTLRLGEGCRTLVITGPNAGGKTVALKTVGLLALMHQHGCHIPAEEGTTMPLFSQIFADIGDQQSIEQDLSTFSSHMGNIKNIVEKADSESLVLLDEIGSSTDPAEGSALAEVILKELTRRNCLTIATTHMGSLKVFAHEESGIENGSMAFDQKTLRPTYRFQAGVPGSSYAFEIAERLGLSKQIVEEAKMRVGEERGKLDRLILHLEEQLQQAHALLAEAEIKESKLSGLVKLYQDRMDDLHKTGKEEQQKILEEAEEVLKEANATVERVVKGIREQQADRESIKTAKEELQTLKKRVKKLAAKKEEREASSFRVGDWVVWEGHGGNGQVTTDPNKSGRVLVQWDGMKLWIPAKELRRIKISKPKDESAGWTQYRMDADIRDEIDLRGLTADEAVEEVERYLGNAVTAGLSQVRIIHGKGTGVLRTQIGRYLKGHSLVKSQRLGLWNEGDTGVTVVELK